MTEDAILFLKFQSQLDFEFFYLSRLLGEWGIKLVPVAPHELSGMMAGNRCHVMGLTRDMTTQKEFLRLRKQFLDYAVYNHRMALFHVSSFDKVYDFYNAENKGNYFHFPLPEEMPKLAEKLAETYYRQTRQDHKWPGGRRAKLPTS